VSRITDQTSVGVQASEHGINGGPGSQRKLDMTQIDQTEKSEIRDLSLEEMEQVGGGMSLTAYLLACKVYLQSFNWHIAKGPLT
jgi:hypothetical protein